MIIITLFFLLAGTIEAQEDPAKCNVFQYNQMLYERNDVIIDVTDGILPVQIDLPDIEKERVFLILEKASAGNILGVEKEDAPIAIYKNESYLRRYFNQYDISVSDISEAYVIIFSSNSIKIIAKSNIGLYHGIKTLYEKFYKNNVIQAPSQVIIDFPIYTSRYASEYYIPDTDFFWNLIDAGVNGFTAAYRWKTWDKTSIEEENALKIVNEFKDIFPSFKFMLQYHLLGRGGEVFDHSSSTDKQDFIYTLDKDIESGNPDSIMICYDDVIPVLSQGEKNEYESPAEAHIKLAEEIFYHVKPLNIEIMLCTPFYQGLRHKKWRFGYINSEIRDEYISTLKLWGNPGIKIVWTGPLTASTIIYSQDILKYKEKIGQQHELFFWDNSWAFRQPIPNFHSDYNDDLIDKGSSRSVLLFIYSNAPQAQIFLRTASSYYWNPGKFSEEDALDSVISELYSQEAVPVFEEYYKLRGDSYTADFIEDTNIDDIRNVFDNMKKYISRDFSEYLDKWILQSQKLQK